MATSRIVYVECTLDSCSSRFTGLPLKHPSPLRLLQLSVVAASIPSLRPCSILASELETLVERGLSELWCLIWAIRVKHQLPMSARLTTYSAAGDDIDAPWHFLNQIGSKQPGPERQYTRSPSRLKYAM